MRVGTALLAPLCGHGAHACETHRLATDITGDRASADRARRAKTGSCIRVSGIGRVRMIDTVHPEDAWRWRGFTSMVQWMDDRKLPHRGARSAHCSGTVQPAGPGKEETDARKRASGGMARRCDMSLCARPCQRVRGRHACDRSTPMVSQCHHQMLDPSTGKSQ